MENVKQKWQKTFRVDIELYQHGSSYALTNHEVISITVSVHENVSSHVTFQKKAIKLWQCIMNCFQHYFCLGGYLNVFSFQDYGLSGVRAGAVYSRNKDIIAALQNIAVFYSIALYLQVVIVYFFRMSI